MIKLGDITYYFLEASQTRTKLQLTMRRALKIDYDDDLLLIRSLNTPMSLEISGDNMGIAHYDPTGFDLALYVIYPPDRRPTELERMRYQSSDRCAASFGSKISSFYIYLPARDLVMTLVHYSADSDLGLEIRLQGEDLMLAFSPILVGKLRAALVA